MQILDHNDLEVEVFFFFARMLFNNSFRMYCMLPLDLLVVICLFNIWGTFGHNARP